MAFSAAMLLTGGVQEGFRRLWPRVSDQLVLGYIGGALGSLCYNVIAKMVGGLEFDFDEVGEAVR